MIENKKRILVISSSPLYLEKGSSLRTYATIEMLSKNYILDLCTYSMGKDFKLENTKIYRTPLFFKPNLKTGKISFFKIILDIFLFLNSLRLIIIKKYDIIHCEDFEGVFIGYFLSFFFRKKKLVYNLHNRIGDNIYKKKDKSKIFKIILFFEKLIIRRVDLIIVNWDHYLEDEIFKNKNKFLFYDKIDTRTSPYEVSFKKYFIYAGNFRSIQGLEGFLETFKEIKTNLKLVLVGKPSKSIIEKIKTNNLRKKILLTGHLPIKETNFLIKNSSFAILPRIDGIAMNMKIITYLIQEKIILAKKNNYNKDFLKDGYNAFLYSNKEELKEKINFFSSKSFNKNLLSIGIKKTKKEIIKNWNEEEFLKKYEYNLK